MENNKTTDFYQIFGQYNAEQEGDIDYIRSSNPNRPDLKYLKWMRAWTEVLKVDPLATYTVIPDPSGNIIHRVGTGGMVHIRVTVLGHSKEEWYPIESAPMKSVPYDNITPSHVNKAIKRGMVKCLAHFGLAANLYLNDELTETEKDSVSLDISEQITRVTSRDQLIILYNDNKQLIDSTPRLLKQFQARSRELQKQ